MAAHPGVSRDAEFADRLRSATNRYFDSIDAWETKYQKFYRMPAPGPVSKDLESEHRSYLAARREMQELIPNARRLCLKHGLRDPWQALLHVNLGGTTPQTGFTPAIGRSERLKVAESLDDLDSACRRSNLRGAADLPEKHEAEKPRGLLRRVLDYFI